MVPMYVGRQNNTPILFYTLQVNFSYHNTLTCTHANNFSEASTDAHSRSSREALMATKQNIGEQIFLRRPYYIDYAYAKVWASTFSKKGPTLMPILQKILRKYILLIY